jgi:hypothetical protein
MTTTNTQPTTYTNFVINKYQFFQHTIFKDELGSNLYLEAIRNDELRKVEREMQHQAEKSILSAVKLVSRVLDDGFNW